MSLNQDIIFIDHVSMPTLQEEFELCCFLGLSVQFKAGQLLVNLKLTFMALSLFIYTISMVQTLARFSNYNTSKNYKNH